MNKRKGCLDELQGAMDWRKGLKGHYKDRHPVYAGDEEPVGIQEMG